MPGPLHGVRVLELTGLGPAPFGAMVLADLGAEVTCVDRPAAAQGRAIRITGGPRDPLARSRRSVAVDLKHAGGVDVVRRLARQADVFVDPFRPGVTERLGLGPDDLRGADPRLVYARMTGWGQDGPLADHAGHDINYLALTGVLHGIGRAGEPPVPPQNYVADFGGGGMLLVVGVLAALFERERSGEGQVLDVAMVDGSALLSGFVRGMIANRLWTDERGTNLLDGGSHVYDAYETADGRYVTIGAIEPHLYDRFLQVAGLAGDERYAVSPLDRDRWADAKPLVASVFRTKTREEWTTLLEGETEMAFAPVLTLDEAAAHPHLRARQTYIDVGGDVQPAPAPRFSRSVPDAPRPGRMPGADTELVLGEAGFDSDEIAALRLAGAVA